MNNLKLKLALFFLKYYFNTLTFFYPEKGGKQAYKLFCKPRKGRLDEPEKKFLSTAISHIFEYKSNKFQVYEWAGNTSQIILLAHGWESNSARWRPIIGKFQKQGYTIMAVDAPAHGASESHYFTALLYAEVLQGVIEKYKPNIVIGHSAGGYAVAYALAHINTSPPSPLGVLWTVSKAILMATPVGFRQIFDIYLNMIKVNKKVVDAFYKHIYDRFGRSTDDFHAANFIKNIPQKLLIIHDKNDSVISYEDALFLKNNALHAELLLTEKYDHRLRGEEVYSAILSFVDKDFVLAK